MCCGGTGGHRHRTGHAWGSVRDAQRSCRYGMECCEMVWMEQFAKQWGKVWHGRGGMAYRTCGLKMERWIGRSLMSLSELPRRRVVSWSISSRMAAKSVNLRPGMCTVNSAYSSSASIRRRCSIRGRLVHIPGPRGRKSRPTCWTHRVSYRCERMRRQDCCRRAAQRQENGLYRVTHARRCVQQIKDNKRQHATRDL